MTRNNLCIIWLSLVQMTSKIGTNLEQQFCVHHLIYFKHGLEAPRIGPLTTYMYQNGMLGCKIANLQFSGKICYMVKIDHKVVHLVPSYSCAMTTQYTHCSRLWEHSFYFIITHVFFCLITPGPWLVHFFMSSKNPHEPNHSTNLDPNGSNQT